MILQKITNYLSASSTPKPHQLEIKLLNSITKLIKSKMMQTSFLLNNQHSKEQLKLILEIIMTAQAKNLLLIEAHQLIE